MMNKTSKNMITSMLLILVAITIYTTQKQTEVDLTQASLVDETSTEEIAKLKEESLEGLGTSFIFSYGKKKLNLGLTLSYNQTFMNTLYENFNALSMIYHHPNTDLVIAHGGKELPRNSGRGFVSFAADSGLILQLPVSKKLMVGIGPGVSASYLPINNSIQVNTRAYGMLKYQGDNYGVKIRVYQDLDQDILDVKLASIAVTYTPD